MGTFLNKCDRKADKKLTTMPFMLCKERTSQNCLISIVATYTHGFKRVNSRNIQFNIKLSENRYSGVEIRSVCSLSIFTVRRHNTLDLDIYILTPKILNTVYKNKQNTQLNYNYQCFYLKSYIVSQNLVN